MLPAHKGAAFKLVVLILPEDTYGRVGRVMVQRAMALRVA